MGDLGSLLSSIFTGAIGANQLFGSGGGSVNGAAAAGAAAASPFGAQFSQYQPQLQSLFNQQGTDVNTQRAAINQFIPQILGMGVPSMDAATLGSPAALGQQLSQLSSNYMDNPAIQAQYKLGLDTVGRGIAAQGLMGSGAQMKELSDYGQQFASNAYQQQFQNILSSNQQAYQQGLLNTQEQAALTGQRTSQILGAGQLEMGLQGQVLNSNQGMLQQLLAASGATTGSPATAGGILSGQFANSQQAASNLGSGLAGSLSRLLGQGGGLPNMPSGIGNFLNDLLGGGGNGLFGAGSNFLSGLLGDSAGTALGDATGLFGSGLFGDAGLGGLSAATGGVNAADALGSFSSLLGFNGGTTAAAGAGAGSSTAAGAGGLGALGAAGPIGLFGLGMLLAAGGTTSAGEEVSNLRHIMQGGVGGIAGSVSPGFSLASAEGPVPWAPLDPNSPIQSWSDYAANFHNRAQVTGQYNTSDWQTIHQYYDWASSNQKAIEAALLQGSAAVGQLSGG